MDTETQLALAVFNAGSVAGIAVAYGSWVGGGAGALAAVAGLGLLGMALAFGLDMHRADPVPTLYAQWVTRSWEANPADVVDGRLVPRSGRWVDVPKDKLGGWLVD